MFKKILSGKILYRKKHQDRKDIELENLNFTEKLCPKKSYTEKSSIEKLNLTSVSSIIFEQTPRGSLEIDYVKEAEDMVKNIQKKI
jgi:hypothetical protein